MRPTLLEHRKFKRLVSILKCPRSHAVGYLEMIWQAAYESGDEFIGDAVDVELAAEWEGESGELVKALLECGGLRAGFIEPVDGGYGVHDLYDHAPDYVQKRRKREDERRISADNGGQRRTTADNGKPPSPSPSPTPTHKSDIQENITPPSNRVKESKLYPQDFDEEIIRFISRWESEYWDELYHRPFASGQHLRDALAIDGMIKNRKITTDDLNLILDFIIASKDQSGFKWWGNCVSINGSLAKKMKDGDRWRVHHLIQQATEWNNRGRVLIASNQFQDDPFRVRQTE
jgi:hypothetical protein